jgi:hypothetical protein
VDFQVGHDRCADAVEEHLIGILAPVGTEDDAVVPVALAGEIQVVAQRREVAAAADPEIAGGCRDLPGVHVREDVGEVDGITAAVDRDVVADADDRDLPGILGRGDVLRAQDLVAVEQVGVLGGEGEAVHAGVRRAGRVERDAGAPRPLVAHAGEHVDGPGCFALSQQDRRVLGGALVGGPEIPGDRIDVGRGTRCDRRERAADVRFVEVAVALDDEPPDREFRDLDLDDAVAEFLLGEDDLDRRIAGVGVAALQTADGSLDGREILPCTGVRLEKRVDP